MALEELDDDELELLELPQAASAITETEMAASHGADRKVLFNKGWISSVAG